VNNFHGQLERTKLRLVGVGRRGQRAARVKEGLAVCAARDACLAVPASRGSRVELSMDVHLGPIEGWTDTRIG